MQAERLETCVSTREREGCSAGSGENKGDVTPRRRLGIVEPW